MKTTYLVVFAFFAFIFVSFKSINLSDNNSVLTFQNTTTIVGVFDGHEDYGYNFIVKGEDDNEHTLTFQKIDEALLKEFDLNATALVGSKFKVTYQTKILVTKDADNFEEEHEINTILKLEKL
ncbi:hypothetical protein [Confluentibacter sediminis]|uniref:hypothetical protein n=1 Tax=Confluentibacter sediminis TaxID=2219045 RepID=UPI000DAD658F|nr:hypothetical protein [Confluentibacter sediminis]